MIDTRLVETMLSSLTVRAWRLHLQTPGVFATVPMLRGVWGAALRLESEAVYQDLFEGGEAGSPRYLMRPTPPDVTPAPSIEFLLFGAPASEADEVVWAAWERASRSGLGPDRRSFRITAAVPLAWDETPLTPSRTQPGFALAPLSWPIENQGHGCRLAFPAPLRLIHRGQLIRDPAPPDLAIAALRRIHALVGVAADPLWPARQEWLEAARSVPFRPWQGGRLDLVRYSGSQKREIEMQGIVGSLDLPDGPGPLAPLLTASQWLHLGKGTVMGLGAVRIEPLTPDRVSARPTIDLAKRNRGQGGPM